METLRIIGNVVYFITLAGGVINLYIYFRYKNQKNYKVAIVNLLAAIIMQLIIIVIARF